MIHGHSFLICNFSFLFSHTHNLFLLPHYPIDLVLSYNLFHPHISFLSTFGIFIYCNLIGALFSATLCLAYKLPHNFSIIPPQLYSKCYTFFIALHLGVLPNSLLWLLMNKLTSAPCHLLDAHTFFNTFCTTLPLILPKFLSTLTHLPHYPLLSCYQYLTANILSRSHRRLT